VEESKEAHHCDIGSALLGQKESILLDPLPVLRAMVGMLVQLKLGGNN
jgi:hypothetical protein